MLLWGSPERCCPGGRGWEEGPDLPRDPRGCGDELRLSGHRGNSGLWPSVGKVRGVRTLFFKPAGESGPCHPGAGMDREREGTCPRPGTGALCPYGQSLLPSATSGKAGRSSTTLYLVSRHTRSVCKAFSPLFSAESLRLKLKNLKGAYTLGFLADCW